MRALVLTTLLAICVASRATAQSPAVPLSKVTPGPEALPTGPAPPIPPAPPVTPTEPPPPEKPAAFVSTMFPDEIEGFEEFPADLQKLVRQSLELTTQNLRYQFGSSDPKAGGMDCSGTMFRVLQGSGVKDVPRQSDEMCRWVMQRAVFYRTEDALSLKDPAFSALKPGDLLFWTGTYETSSPRELPVSHVMIYLGKRKKDGKPVIFGASDGRTYEGQRRNGVSVFDFNLPKRGEKSAFYGYGPIPGLDVTPKPQAGTPAVKAS